VWWKLVVESAGFVPGAVGNAKAIYDVARAVDDAGNWLNRNLLGGQDEQQYFAPDAQVLKDGSFMVPLALLEGYGVEIFRDFGFWCSYLWVTFLDHDGQSRSFAFSDKHVIPGGKSWEESITAAREASTRGD
jgi:hypothetical protein